MGLIWRRKRNHKHKYKERPLEYKTVLVTSSGFSKHHEGDINRTIKRMSARGWRLVGSSYSGGFFSNRSTLTFARPKPPWKFW